MKFSDGIKMAAKDLRRRLGRTILTTIGIVIGTFLVVAMISLGLGFKSFLVNDFQNTFGSKLIRVLSLDSSAKEKMEKADEEMDVEVMMNIQEDEFKKIDNETIEDIKKENGVESVIAKIEGNANSIKLGDKNKDGFIPVTGYSLEGNLFSEDELEIKKKSKPNENMNFIKYGESLSKDKNGEALLEERFVKDAFDIDDSKSVIGKEVTVIVSEANEMKINPVSKTFKIVGIINSEVGEYGIITSSQDASEIISASKLTKDYLNESGYQYIDVYSKTTEEVDSVSEAISNNGYYNKTIKEAITGIQESLDSINLVLGLLGVIVLAVAAIGIVNTMTMAVNERTKSIGVMKSQGATSGDIQLIFMTQSGLIGFIGGIIGSLLGMGAAKLGEIIINGAMASEPGAVSITLTTPSILIVLTIVAAIGIAVLSGLYPSIKASKMSPVEALR